MATYTSPGVNYIPQAGPTGNGTFEVFSITGNGAGSTAAAGSVLRLGIMPRDIEVTDVRLALSAATTSLAGSVGYEPVDSVAGPTADADAFHKAATAIATAVIFPANAGDTMPVTLRSGRTYLTVTTSGATLAADTVVKAIVHYRWLGPL